MASATMPSLFSLDRHKLTHELICSVEILNLRATILKIDRKKLSFSQSRDKHCVNDHFDATADKNNKPNKCAYQRTSVCFFFCLFLWRKFSSINKSFTPKFHPILSRNFIHFNTAAHLNEENVSNEIHASNLKVYFKNYTTTRHINKPQPYVHRCALLLLLCVCFFFCSLECARNVFLDFSHSWNVVSSFSMQSHNDFHIWTKNLSHRIAPTFFFIPIITLIRANQFFFNCTAFVGIGKTETKAFYVLNFFLHTDSIKNKTRFTLKWHAKDSQKWKQRNSKTLLMKLINDEQS